MMGLNSLSGMGLDGNMGNLVVVVVVVVVVVGKLAAEYLEKAKECLVCDPLAEYPLSHLARM